MNQIFAIICLAIVTCAATTVRAGYVEVGVSGNFKKVNLSEESYDEGLSLTGSLSYLFDEMSALELSYTNGNQKRFIRNDIGDTTTTVDYSLIGLDFIFTMGSRESILRPYIKAGVAHILEKNLVTVYNIGTVSETIVDKIEPATVPSAGLGARIAITKHLSLKIGVDMWTSKSISEDDYKWDMAGRAGLSWMF